MSGSPRPGRRGIPRCLVDEQLGLGGVVGEVDVADRLLRKPRPEHLLVGVADAKRQKHPIDPHAVEPLGAFEHHLADPIERVALSAAVSCGLVLYPSAHLVEAAVGDPHHVEGIGDADGMVEAPREACAVGLGQVRRDDPHGLQPRLGLVVEPRTQITTGVSLDDVESRSAP